MNDRRRHLDFGVLPSKAKNWYIVVAVGVLNGILLLLIVNLVFYAVKAVIVRSRSPKISDTIKAYPGWREEDVKALLTLMTQMGLPMEYEPFTQFKEKPLKGRFVNVDRAGFRISKNQAPWPPRPEVMNVFVFGGSTTFGYGLPDDETIPSYLGECPLRNNSQNHLAIYNFGRGGYMSTQELILFQQLLNAGFRPQVAVFIDGLNDFILADGQPAFTDKLARTMAGQIIALDNVPMVWAAHWLSHRGAKTDYAERAVLEGVIKRWMANKTMIEVVAKAYRVRTIFVWQPVPTYKYDRRYDLFPYSDKAFGGAIRTKYGYPLMENLWAQKKLEPDVLWLADIQQDKRENLYVDTVHYTAAFSKELASRICGFLREDSDDPDNLPHLVRSRQ